MFWLILPSPCPTLVFKYVVKSNYLNIDDVCLLLKQSPVLNKIFESLGLYNFSEAFKNLIGFVEKTIAEHVDDFNPDDEDKDLVHAYLKDTLGKRWSKLLLPVIYATRCVFFNATRCNLLSNLTE